MNSTIKTIFNNFTVNGVSIPVEFLRYDGHENTFITFMETDKDYGDNELMNYISYYDFDIYSKGNYLNIVEEVKKLMKANGFMWEPSRDSADMYETDTGFFHKTICFAIEREVQ